ncbi:hypothetical protein EIP91_006991 [Steccherinum ochraceum]|uniref:HNH domain-containing protein n=1 Tax=Steccherinum ochraceum TaxID=92696 RepID=A0A4R0RUW0_9APHY|nr:hypothetical protein EIP91_006991 [Steccherinum ochraceum]
MNTSPDDTSSPQFSLFKDCLAKRLIARGGILEASSTSASGEDDKEDLDDFTLYLTSEVWSSLPQKVHSATYETRHDVPALGDGPGFTLDTILSPVFVDTLASIGVMDAADVAGRLLSKVVEDYMAEACAPPPVWSKTRTTECEICEREVPLTYHHLIPREVHAKVLKKKWHPESMLNSVAWLCRPCHSAVHHVASNEELAKSLYTVELLLEREDIQRWRKYATKQRFGVKRG